MPVIKALCINPFSNLKVYPITRIQFQKGLSLAGFYWQYGAEEQYRQALFQWRWPKGSLCPACEGRRFCVLFNGHYQCNDCHRQTSLTAGTILAAQSRENQRDQVATHHLVSGDPPPDP
ncbi:MAG: transposase [Thermoplasmata archaeon]|nr:transposase [Candidatus Sysuiplasma jiujiangense]